MDPVNGNKPSDGILKFPCDGPVSEWWLREEQLKTLTTLYPTLDVLNECRKAWAWIEAHPTKRKTARGMPRFIVAWLNRADTDRVVSHRGAAPMPSYTSWGESDCPHVERHDTRFRCDQATTLGRPVRNMMSQMIDSEKELINAIVAESIDLLKAMRHERAKRTTDSAEYFNHAKIALGFVVSYVKLRATLIAERELDMNAKTFISEASHERETKKLA